MEKLIAWVEIPTENFERAVKFYNDVLKLDLKPMDFGTEKMACLPNDEGAIVYTEGFKPSNQGAVVSFNAGDDLDACLERVKENGGSIIQEKSKIEAEGRGYFALFNDTEGNRVGLYGN